MTRFFDGAIQLYFPQSFESQKAKPTGLDRGDSLHDQPGLHQNQHFNAMGMSLGSGVNGSSKINHVKEENIAGNSIKADQEKRRH